MQCDDEICLLYEGKRGICVVVIMVLSVAMASRHIYLVPLIRMPCLIGCRRCGVALCG